jgi:GT2 family glycosyltransferase
MGNLPTVTIIVLNWNGRSYLEACLDALLDQTQQADEIILVDNGSTDDSVELVQTLYPAVKIQEIEINRGYAAGNNSALRTLASEVGILINPDIVVRPNWLENLLQALAGDTAVGIAGCKLLFPGEQQLQHAGGYITHPRAMPAHRGMYDRDEGQLDTPDDVDFVTGAALAVRREVLETAGYLDEGFFMYFEDADWCARARRAGFRVRYVAQATAVHDESALAVRGSPSYLRRFHSGRWRYLLKHFDAAEIIEKTLPSEHAWLAEIEGQERRALGWAYRHTLDDFPSIMAARQAHGAAQIRPSDQATIMTRLLDLRRQSLLWADNPERWQRLAKKGQIKAHPFHSPTPILGPLFARLRDIWAGISAKSYIGALNEQQNAFNQSFVRELQAVEEKLREVENNRLNQEAAERELSWEIKALREELNRSYELLAGIESRIDKSFKQNDGVE